MRFLFVVLITCLSLGASAPSRAQATGDKVFVAAITPGAAADPAVVALLDDRLLTSMRRLKGVTVVGARDVASLMDLEATRQQSGCIDGVSCAAEIAGALDAPQLVTGQLGRVGSTWVLSLARLERGSLTVMSRASREFRGDAPDGLLASMDGQVDELFDVAANPVGIAAGVGATVGALGVAAAAGLSLASWSVFNAAVTDLEAEGDPSRRAQLRAEAKATGALVNTGAVIALGVGSVAAVAAGSLATLRWLGVGE